MIKKYLKKIIFRLFREPLSHEAYIAYFHKLPDRIQVDWFRDGDFIIGKIKSDENEVMTQARNAEEFVDMVNDALITTYDIPIRYVDVIKQSKAYIPSADELNKLNDLSINKSTFGLMRQAKPEARLA